MNKPLCPKCKIFMEIHKTMSGDQWICDNYHACGGRIPVEEFKAEQERKDNG